MRTILEVIGISELEESKSVLLDIIDDEIISCKNSGDLLGAGEWYTSKIIYADEEQLEEFFVKTVSLWGSPIELKALPSSIKELIDNFNEFVPEDLAAALVTAQSRILHLQPSISSTLNDLAFRLRDQLSSLFGIETKRPADMLKNATTKLETLFQDLQFAVESFANTNCVTAKVASIDVVKKGHQLKKVALVREKPILSDLDILLGPTFRKFCESYERQETSGIIKRAPDLKEQAQRILSSSGGRASSVLWNLIIDKTARHVLKLIEEGTNRSKIAVTPSLKLGNNNIKLELFRLESEMTFSNRLLNQGEGRATKIDFEVDLPKNLVEIQILEPSGLFEIDGSSEQIIKFGIKFHRKRIDLKIPILWKCETITGQLHTNQDYLDIKRQMEQPEWDKLLKDPPYSLNPIKSKEKLYGRNEILSDLILHASSGTSTFLWGQKRVGKTSILQVLASLLQKMDNYVCLVFRMGELGPLHEGQIGHKIAERLCRYIHDKEINIPNEKSFGTGINRLVPFMEDMVHLMPGWKFVVIIDEFDDLDHAFYTGERGKLFMKGIRSLSECMSSNDSDTPLSDDFASSCYS